MWTTCAWRSCSLSIASSSRSVAAASSLREASTAALEGTTVGALAGCTSSTPHSAALNVRVCTGLQATLLYYNTIVTNLVGVGIDGGLVTFGCLEVDEGAVLYT